jgi:hypothetical protein
MEAIKIRSFRSNYITLAKRLLAINGYHANASYNPYNVKAYVISNEYGPFCVSIGSCFNEALDYAVDCNCLDHYLAEDQDYDNEDLFSLGDAGELFDLTYISLFDRVSQYE